MFVRRAVRIARFKAAVVAREADAINFKSLRAHVGVEYSAHITVRDSYFFLTQNSIDQSYGIDCFASSDNLIENNIYQAVSGALTMNGCTGTVFGYNYAINGYYTGSTG